MKKLFCTLAIAALWCVSCGTGDYPPFVYTNASGEAIAFQTTEKDSPVYPLEVNGSLSLDSDVRGRADILAGSIKPAYITWKRDERDIYSIKFGEMVEERIEAKITNFTNTPVTISEKKGLMKPESIDVSASGQDISARMFTKTPSFELELSGDYPLHTEYRIDDSGSTKIMYISIK